MKNKNFFAMVNRMKFISRWGLMRNTIKENISEHSHQVAVIAHAICVIGNKKFGKNYNCERACLLALYHDTTEIITGDMPTPVKYFNPSIVEAYREVETFAGDRLLEMLPEDLRSEYYPLFHMEENDSQLWEVVKAADKISALIKSIEEEKAGNAEFSSAVKSLKEKVACLPLAEVQYFVEEFLPSYSLTLDEHTK